MSDEASINVNLNIDADNVKYRSHPTNFRTDVTGRKGPVPGAFDVSVLGVNVDLSQLTVPGLAILKNIESDDSTDYVTYGIYDTSAGRFYPLGELWPGDVWPIRLSRNLGDEISGTSSGTVSGSGLHMRSHAGTVRVSVEAFEK